MSRRTQGDGHLSVYVIELRDGGGPRIRPDKPCVYVGSTGQTPEERFAEHLRGGFTASRVVHRRGVRLRPRLYRHLNPIATKAEAESIEGKHARRLLRKGFTVYGGGVTREDRARRRRDE